MSPSIKSGSHVEPGNLGDAPKVPPRCGFGHSGTCGRHAGKPAFVPLAMHPAHTEIDEEGPR